MEPTDPLSSGNPESPPPPVLVYPPDVRCVQHPASPATAQCSSCGAYMCATCDFALDGGLHLCPSCATKPRTTLGKKRKSARMWSFILAIGSTVGFIVATVIAGMRNTGTEVDAQMIGVLFSVFVLVPSICGLGIGLGAIDRRYSNPGSLWAAVIWNGIVLGGFLLLSVIGLMQ